MNTWYGWIIFLLLTFNFALWLYSFDEDKWGLDSGTYCTIYCCGQEVYSQQFLDEQGQIFNIQRPRNCFINGR